MFFIWQTFMHVVVFKIIIPKVLIVFYLTVNNGQYKMEIAVNLIFTLSF